MLKHSSPYISYVDDFVKAVNQPFVQTLGISLTDIRDDDIAPGDRYGIITFTEARPDRATNIRGGIEQWAIAMDVIIRQGCDGYMSGEAEKLKLFLDLHNIFPSEIREGLPTGWAVNLSLNGSFRFSTQTSHKPAGKPTFVDPLPQTQTQSPKYNFIITTTTSFIATVWIGVNYEGQQYIPYPLT